MFMFIYIYIYSADWAYFRLMDIKSKKSDVGLEQLDLSSRDY
jgi:hypothetical protein